jgi:hypothetical protein
VINDVASRKLAVGDGPETNEFGIVRWGNTLMQVVIGQQIEDSGRAAEEYISYELKFRRRPGS